MLKSEIVKLLTKDKPEKSAKNISSAVDIILDSISNNLVAEGRAEIRGFGSFSASKHPSRTARNPKTGEKVTTEEKLYAHFKPSKSLRERVNKTLSPAEN